MPPHLHPRSRSTSLLFTGTLLASFIIVGIPHVFPCPAPRKRLADSPPSQIVIGPDGQTIPQQRPLQRRRRRQEDDSGGFKERALSELTRRQVDSDNNIIDGQDTRLKAQKEQLLRAQEEAIELEAQARECPVPKPRGVLGSLLGFSSKNELGVERAVGRPAGEGR